MSAWGQKWASGLHRTDTPHTPSCVQGHVAGWFRAEIPIYFCLQNSCSSAWPLRLPGMVRGGQSWRGRGLGAGVFLAHSGAGWGAREVLTAPGTDGSPHVPFSPVLPSCPGHTPPHCAADIPRAPSPRGTSLAVPSACTMPPQPLPWLAAPGHQGPSSNVTFSDRPASGHLLPQPLSTLSRVLF